ncbi:MAG: hypothetical protein AABM67_22165 [Acidobacteriota bacterium]
MDLKPLDRTDRAKKRLNEALGIYRDTILPEAQNPERQILYWIDHSKSNLADEFRCFAIQRDNEVIGYLQYSFFREEHIFFFEYLCIRDSERKGLVSSVAMKSIEDFLAQNYSPGFTIVFEIAQTRDSKGDWQPDRKLIVYFQRLGFRNVSFSYRYPILQSYFGEISYPADLMVWLPAKRTQITSSEIRTILRCIYFKHYLRWDRPFLEPDRFAERERLINDLYSQQVAQIGDIDTFGTIGDKNRSQVDHFANRHPRIRALLDRIFGPKLPRLFVVIIVLLAAQWMLGSSWLLIPFVLAVAAIYCLAEDTAESRKLFVVVLSRFKSLKPRSS